MKWKSGALSAGKVCEVEKTVRFYSLGTSLTSRASTDTVTNREKERFKFLYPYPTLDQPLKNLGAATFRLVNTNILDGSATTFRGDIPALLRQLPLLEQTFSAWPGFTGMALHEIP